MTAPQPETAAALSLVASRNAQARVSREMVDLAASAVRRFGIPESPADRKAMSARIHPLVERARRQSYVIAAHQMQSSAPLLRPEPIRPYPVDAVETVIRDVVEETAELAAPAKKKPRVSVREVAPSESRKKPRVRVSENLGARLARHAHQAGRDMVVDTAGAAGESVGWARVLTGAENCAWCVMLASRGPVYRSEMTATAASGKRGNRAVGEEYHDRCDCQAVIVYKGRDWAGRAQFELYEDLWLEATRGFSGNAALNALRRQLARAQRDGITHQQLLDTLRAES